MRTALVLALLVVAAPAHTQPLPTDPLETALAWLRTQPPGIAARPADLAEFVVADRYRSRSTGITHLVLRQRIRGIEVVNGDLQINVGPDGSIVNAHDGFVRREAARADTPAITAARALEGAARALGLPAAPATIEAEASGPGRSQQLRAPGVSRRPVPAKLAYLPLDSGELRLVWSLDIDLPGRPRRAYAVHVDAATGEPLTWVDRVAHDAYAAYSLPLQSPDDGPRTLEVDPADPTASPFGWHDRNGLAGADTNFTEGGNIIATEDRDADDAGGFRPNGGANRVFDFPVDLLAAPAASEAAAISHAFYLTNRLHDVFHRYGFDEPAGNYQERNFGRGGLEGDPLFVDVQDGAETNNAAFFITADGSPGVMELYLWDSTPASVVVNAPPAIAGELAAGDAAFGPLLPPGGVSGMLVQALDAAEAADPQLELPAGTTTDACSPLDNPGAISGRIALVDRGRCLFVEKVRHAQLAGATAVVVVNHLGNEILSMGGEDPTITIPSVFLAQSDGALLEGQLGAGVNVTLLPSTDNAIDSAYDNTLITHEYVHGVSSRLTGGPSNFGCLNTDEADGMSEGWSDFFAIAFTALAGETRDDPRGVANFVTGEPAGGPGIRRFPYSTDLGVNPLTYADVSASFGPHDTGEIWALALWEVWWNLVDRVGFDPSLVDGAGGNNRMLQLVVDGLKLGPCNPTFLDGRDALLAADQALYSGFHACDIWRGFAKRGIGEGAVSGPGLNVTENFDVPVQCVPEVGSSLAALAALVTTAVCARRRARPAGRSRGRR